MAHTRDAGWGQYLGVGFVVDIAIYLAILVSNFGDRNLDGQTTIGDLGATASYAFAAPGWWIASQFPVSVQQFFEVYAGNPAAPIVLSVFFWMATACVVAWVFDTFEEQIVGRVKKP